MGQDKEMTLIDAIMGFNGKHIAKLRSAAERFRARDATDLAKMCLGADAVAATWVVKALCEKGRANELDLNRVFAALGEDLDWEAALHLLQSVKYAPNAAAPFASAIINFLDHPKVLVRVWALDAFVRLSLVAPKYQSDAKVRVNDALSAKAASLRARARVLENLLG